MVKDGIDRTDADADIRDLLAAKQYDTAFEQLLQRYDRKAYHLSLSYLRNSADAEEAAQQAFVRIWKALPGYDGRASLATWIYVIVRNVCLSELRRPARRGESLDDNPEPSGGSGGEAAARIDCERLLAVLPEAQRSVVVLYYLEGRSYQQTADMLGLPVNTIRSHLHRARKRMAAAARGETS